MPTDDDLKDAHDRLMNDIAGDKLREELDLKIPAEVAAMIGVTEQTLAQWRHEGKGPAPTYLGKSVFYHLKDLDIWVQNCSAARALPPTHLVMPGHD